MKYSNWTIEEIGNYNRNYKRKNLGQMYLAAGISNNEPHRRLEYLVEKLKISVLEKKEISKILKEEEYKPFILAKLEDRAIMNFF